MILTPIQIEQLVANAPAERLSSNTIIKQRREICNSCEKQITRLGMDVCNECGCFIALNSAFKFTPCPLGKWPVAEIKNVFR